MWKKYVTKFLDSNLLKKKIYYRVKNIEKKKIMKSKDKSIDTKHLFL